MSLDVSLLEMRYVEVFEQNITHNLNVMAEAAGIYKHLWRPEELCVNTAEELIQPLKEGLNKLLADPEKFRQYSPENGWGDYEGLVKFVRKYLEACEQHPKAMIQVDR